MRKLAEIFSRFSSSRPTLRDRAIAIAGFLVLLLLSAIAGGSMIQL